MEWGSSEPPESPLDQPMRPRLKLGRWHITNAKLHHSVLQTQVSVIHIAHCMQEMIAISIRSCHVIVY